MTLKELALQLKEIYNFDVLTCCDWDDCKLITLYKRYNKDSLLPEYKDYHGTYRWIGGETSYISDIKVRDKTFYEPLDLSEYKDSEGNIDYSKCIVEV